MHNLINSAIWYVGNSRYMKLTMSNFVIYSSYKYWDGLHVPIFHVHICVQRFEHHQVHLFKVMAWFSFSHCSDTQLVWSLNFGLENSRKNLTQMDNFIQKCLIFEHFNERFKRLVYHVFVVSFRRLNIFKKQLKTWLIETKFVRSAIIWLANDAQSIKTHTN